MKKEIDSIPFNYQIIEELKGFRNDCLRQIKRIDSVMKKIEATRLKKFSCPHCHSIDVRVNISDIYCRRCGIKSERIGDRIIK